MTTVLYTLDLATGMTGLHSRPDRSALSTDDLLALLVNGIRRTVLFHLRQHRAATVAELVDVVVAQSTELTMPEHVESVLYHVHLPKLTASGLVRSLFNNTQDALFVIDVTGESFRLERVNPAYETITGLSNEVLCGRPLTDVFGAEEVEAILRKYRTCVETREPLEYEEEVSVPSAGPYWETRLSPVVVDDRVVRLVGATRNMVEAAHERIGALITDLLTLAREGQQVTETSKLALGERVSRAFELIPSDGATLDLAVGEYTIQADEARLEQLLDNLLGNAIRHGGPDVTVRVGLLDHDAGFYVADDGPGIPEAKRDEVFDHGYSTEGTGLGLAIVKSIAAAHGWQVSVTESAAGGAKFEVCTE